MISLSPATLALLDADAGEATAQVESSHDPTRCAPQHDHTACLQLLRVLADSPAGWEPVLDSPAGRSATRPDAPGSPGPRAFSPVGPRAPPLSLL